MATNTAVQYFGEGVDTSKIFDLEEIDSNGIRKCCTGNKPAPHQKWYGLNDFGQSGIVFCEHCAKNSISKAKIFELTEFYDKSTLRCSTIYTNKCLDKNIDNRIKKYKGISFNVNIINQVNSDFAPATKPLHHTYLHRANNNELYVQMPSGCYYEITLKGDKDYRWGKNMCFKIESGWLGDGRDIIYRSANGGEVYCDCPPKTDTCHR